MCDRNHQLNFTLLLSIALSLHQSGSGSGSFSIRKSYRSKQTLKPETGLTISAVNHSFKRACRPS